MRKHQLGFLTDPSFLLGHMICFLPLNEKFVANIEEREGISWYARHSLAQTRYQELCAKLSMVF